MMRVFQLAQEHGLDLSPELEDLLNRRLGKLHASTVMPRSRARFSKRSCRAKARSAEFCA